VVSLLTRRSCFFVIPTQSLVPSPPRKRAFPHPTLRHHHEALRTLQRTFHLYKAPPVKRTHIPKGMKGETRPIGIPTFEDKIVQRHVQERVSGWFDRRVVCVGAVIQGEKITNNLFFTHWFLITQLGLNAPCFQQGKGQNTAR